MLGKRGFVQGWEMGSQPHPEGVDTAWAGLGSKHKSRAKRGVAPLKAE